MIRKVGDQWYLYDSKGTRILGRHNSRVSALKQERAIYAHKNSRIKMKKSLPVQNLLKETMQSLSYFLNEHLSDPMKFGFTPEAIETKRNGTGPYKSPYYNYRHATERTVPYKTKNAPHRRRIQNAILDITDCINKSLVEYKKEQKKGEDSFGNEG